jgi:hypothetical protein
VSTTTQNPGPAPAPAPVAGSVAGSTAPHRTPALRFAETARRLGASARASGLAVPAFRCPPRVAGAARTIRRYPGGVVVSVRLRDRPFDEVVTDMVEGVLVANRLAGEAALRHRTSLLDAARPGEAPGSAGESGPVPSTAPARMAERQTQAA